MCETSSTNNDTIIQKHKNGFMRFIIIAIGLPLTLLAYIFPLHAFLLPRILFTVFLLLMILETHALLPADMRPHKKLWSLCAGLIFPVVVFISIFIPSFAPYQYATALATFVAIVFLFSLYGIFALPSIVIEKIGGLLFIAFYPGLLGSYYILLPNLSDHIIHLITVTGIVYCNDGMAYLMGRFFHKKKQRKTPLVKVSASKTAIGFISGFLSGMIYFGIVYTVQDKFFTGSLGKIILFATLVNIAGMLGDLFESALKRSAQHKDSGSIMLGRGGVLDTFDSLLTASAMYYIIYPLFF